MILEAVPEHNQRTANESTMFGQLVDFLVYPESPEQSGEIHGSMTHEKNHFGQVAVGSAARNIILRPLYVALRTSNRLVGACGVYRQAM
jgi:hypothetical protein